MGIMISLSGLLHALSAGKSYCLATSKLLLRQFVICRLVFYISAFVKSRWNSLKKKPELGIFTNINHVKLFILSNPNRGGGMRINFCEHFI